MIVVSSIFILFLTAVLSCVGIAVLRHHRHSGARKLLAAAAITEFCMAVGLALLVAIPHFRI